MVHGITLYGRDIFLDASRIISSYKKTMKRISTNPDNDVGILRSIMESQRELFNLYHIVKFQRQYKGLSSLDDMYDTVSKLIGVSTYEVYRKIINIPITPTLDDEDKAALICAKNNLRRIGAYDADVYKYIVRQEKKIKKQQKKLEVELKKSKLLVSSDSLGSLPVDKIWSLINNGYNGLGTLGERDIYINRDSIDIVNTYCDDEHIREMAYRNVYYLSPKAVSLSNVILRYKNKISTKLGYDSYTTFLYELGRYKNTTTANSILETYNEGLDKIYKGGLKLVCEFAEDMGQNNPLKPWNIPYYINKYIATKYAKDIKCFETHLNLDRVVQCMMTISKRIMGVSVNLSVIDGVYKLELVLDNVVQGYIYIDATLDYRGEIKWETLGYTDCHPLGVILMPPRGYLSFREYITISGKFGECLYMVLSRAGLEYPFVPSGLESQLMEVNSQIFRMCCLERQIINEPCVNAVSEIHTLLSTYEMKLLCTCLAFDIIGDRTIESYLECFHKFMSFRTYGVPGCVAKDPVSLSKIEVIKMSLEIYYSLHVPGYDPGVYRESIVDFGLGQTTGSILRRLRKHYNGRKNREEENNNGREKTENNNGREKTENSNEKEEGSSNEKEEENSNEKEEENNNGVESRIGVGKENEIEDEGDNSEEETRNST